MRKARNLSAVGLLILLISLGLPHLLENFHTVSNGVVYRSAQLSPNALIRQIEKYGIKSILNLRGTMTGSDWYDEEIKASKRMRVVHYDIDLSAKRRVSPDRLKEILSLIENAPKPILIHCEGGADRTGLVSAVWKLAAEHASPATARGQISIIFGHFPHFFWHESTAMDASFEAFAAAIR